MCLSLGSIRAAVDLEFVEIFVGTVDPESVEYRRWVANAAVLKRFEHIFALGPLQRTHSDHQPVIRRRRVDTSTAPTLRSDEFSKTPWDQRARNKASEAGFLFVCLVVF